MKNVWTYRQATPDDLERIWNMNIADHPEDGRWVGWKETYISYNQNGQAATFVAFCDGRPVGEGTLLFDPACNAVRERTDLADGVRITNLNALRIRKEYEGQGHISALVRCMEACAAERGFSRITIGVEAKETRNLAIYLHWGYDRFVRAETEDGELVLYYGKELRNTTYK